MGTTKRALLNLSYSANCLFYPANFSVSKKSTITTSAYYLASRLFSSSFSRTSTNGSAVENDKPPQSDRDAMLLDKFKLRKLKGSSKITQQSSSSTTGKKGSENGVLNRGETTQVMSGFKDLGIRKELVEAVEEMGLFVPSELHCIGIPALLDGKNVVLGSVYVAERALVYLLPLIQNLKRDGERNVMRPKHPRAFVLCSTEELSDEVFQMAKFISNYDGLKSARDNGCGQFELQEDASGVSIGLLIGTPNEVCELIEEGNVIPDEINYLVLDELDTMFDLGFGPNITKILGSIKKLKSSHCNQQCQSVLVSSMMIKMLHERHSTLVKSLKHDDAGEITAMLLEIDEDEVFHLMESSETLKSKVADAVESLQVSTRGS